MDSTTKPKNLEVYVSSRFATFGSRFVAYSVDIFITSLFSFLLAILLSPLIFVSSEENLDAPVSSQGYLPVLVIFVLIVTVYHVFSMTRFKGQTPGKMLMGIRVVKKDGTPLTPVDIILRNVVGYAISSVFWNLGFLWSLFDGEKRTWHDRIIGTVVVDDLPDPTKPRTLLNDTWRQFRKHSLAMIAIMVLSVIVISVIIGPFVWTVEPTYIDIIDAYQLTSAEHPFGTDNLGRDTLARVLSGGRVSLMIGISAMMVAMALGTGVGLLSGYFDALDNLLMRITDIFIALPQLPLLLVLTMLFREPLKAQFGPEGGIFILTVVVIGGLQWMPTARLVRGEVLTVKSREFIVAANALGSSNGRILARHILPNVLSPVIVAATFSIASAIITESALSFLGLGFPPDFPTWGRILFDGKDYLTITWTLVFWPGMLISLTVLCVNFIGDGLRDALDPRLRK
jgi:peptide/nickel transport system permease protein